MRFLTAVLLAAPLAGCVALDPTLPAPIPRAPHTAFTHVGRFDFRTLGSGGGDSLADFKAQLQPGDLVVAYLDPHRAILTGQLPFLVLPCGHSLVAVPSPRIPPISMYSKDSAF